MTVRFQNRMNLRLRLRSRRKPGGGLVGQRRDPRNPGRLAQRSFCFFTLSRRGSVTYTPRVFSELGGGREAARCEKESIMFGAIIAAIVFFGLLYLLALDFVIATA
jgi:hypothetical protein